LTYIETVGLNHHIEWLRYRW